jgi:hypothetical protein
MEPSRVRLSNRPWTGFFLVLFILAIWPAFQAAAQDGQEKNQSGQTGKAQHPFVVTQIRPQNLLLIKGGHKPGFEVTLPYADDWQLSRKLPQTLLWADSKTADLIASVTVDSEKQPDAPEKYLQDLGKRLSAKYECQDSRLVRVGGTLVLSYRISLDKHGGTGAQTNFWAVRRTPQGEMYRLHISSTNGDSEFLKKMAATIPSLMDKGFKVTD